MKTLPIFNVFPKTPPYSPPPPLQPSAVFCCLVYLAKCVIMPHPFTNTLVLYQTHKQIPTQCTQEPID